MKSNNNIYNNNKIDKLDDTVKNYKNKTQKLGKSKAGESN